MKKTSINLILLLVSTITINASQQKSLRARKSFENQQIAHYGKNKSYCQETRFSKKQPVFNFVPTFNTGSSSKISQFFALVTIAALINTQGAIAVSNHHINLNCENPRNFKKCQKFTKLYNESQGKKSLCISKEGEEIRCYTACEEDCFKPESDTCLKCTCPTVCNYADNDLKTAQLCDLCKKIGIIKTDGSLRPLKIITKECKAHCKDTNSEQCIQCNCKKECKKIKSLECQQCTCGYLCDTFDNDSCTKCYESILLKNK